MNPILSRIRRRLSQQRFPDNAKELERSNLLTGWWYYSVELLPGLITKGQYPDSFPLLPRILLRNCDLHGTTCLDLGSMEGLMPVVMCRQGANEVLATDAIDHCHHIVECLLPLLDGQKWQRHHLVFGLEPPGANTKNRSPAGEIVEIGLQAGDIGWMSIGGGHHQLPEPQLRGHRGDA